MPEPRMAYISQIDDLFENAFENSNKEQVSAVLREDLAN